MSDAILKENGKLYTLNLTPHNKVYGEKLVKKDNKEYREWDPTRSKLAAAILSGLSKNPIKKGKKILYLGASTGTTVSHISDIVKDTGLIYAVELAERVIRKLVNLSDKRDNIVPLLKDARKTDEYNWLEECDILYVDIAQSDQTQIAIRNALKFLKPDGHLMLSVKSQSIDVTKNPKQVFKEEKEKLEDAGFSVKELINIEKYEKGHCFIMAKK